MELVPILLGVFGLGMAVYVYMQVLKYPQGDGKAAEIAREIQKGAMAFLIREYSILFLFVVIVAASLFYAFETNHTAIAFLVGAFFSAAAGWFGMYTATRANVRTTVAASEHGASEALTVAFFGGSIMGLTVAAAGLLGLGLLYFFWGHEHAEAIHGFGMGASSVALFSRVGGGIFTKSADVGADLVGKIEAGIPEDDPRNPGVIADNVGDNVGDIAGMGSDIFESYCGSMIASIAIASTMTAVELSRLGNGITNSTLSFLPLALSSVGLLCSIAGIFLVKRMSDKSPEQALRYGTIGATLIFIVAALLVTLISGIALSVWGCVVAGAVGGMVIGLVTEFYTGGAPVRRLAADGETGPATIMISGLALGMESVVVPVLTLCAIIFAASSMVGLYGVGIAAVGMLATVGISNR